MQVLMVGCGKMGSALLAQWAGLGGFTFTVVDPACTSAPEGAALVASRSELGDSRFDLLIIAIKPQMIDAVMPDYRDILTPSGFAASIAAGFSLSRLQSALQTDKIVRIMPNLPAAIGMGVAGLIASEAVPQAQKSTIETLMARTGLTIWVKSEDQLDRLTAISGSGPGYVFEIARVYADAAQALGFDAKTARDMALATLSGTAMMAISEPDTPLATLRDNVTSKKGTTEAGLKALNGDGGLTGRFEQTVRAAYDRAVELRDE